MNKMETEYFRDSWKPDYDKFEYSGWKLLQQIRPKDQILDIGCGRANIISALKNRYKFQEKPIGLDIVKNKGIKRNIIFKICWSFIASRFKVVISI